jgi:hypothetical protein
MSMLNTTLPTRPSSLQPVNPGQRFRKMIEVLTDHLGDRKDSLLDYKAEALLVEGKERHHLHDLRTLYVGALSNRDFILSRIYDRYDVAMTKHLHIWRAGGCVRDIGHLAELIVMDLPWPYPAFLPRKSYIESPAWVSQRAEISGEWSEVERRFSKEARTEDFRKIRKYGFTYETTTDAAAIETFYDQMYRPYLAHRFGDLASIEPRWKIAHFAQQGKLLQIKRDDRVVAAAVLYEWDKCMHFLWTGTSEEPRSPLGRGAFSALYYYTIWHAFERGCDRVDFEGTRPLLNDGVFLFKRKWGSCVCDGWSLDTLLFRPQKFVPAVVSFFAHNPLVIRKGNVLVGKILFDHEGQECTSNDLEVIVKRYGGSGLKRLEIASTGGYRQDAWEYAQSSPHEMHLADLSRTGASVEERFVTH